LDTNGLVREARGLGMPVALDGDELPLDRVGTFEPVEPRPRLAPGPAEVAAAAAEARARVL
jgi:hypothetical protein